MQTFPIILTHSGIALITINLPFMPQVGDTLRIARKPTAIVRNENEGINRTYNYFLKIVNLEHAVENSAHNYTLAAVEFDDNDGFIPEEWGYTNADIRDTPPPPTKFIACPHCGEQYLTEVVLTIEEGEVMKCSECNALWFARF